ncbi:EF-hand domain-containing protein 1-like [Phymastichus coffea]|uniref:EF-hand domain-containing protein 1-like n=1 Tax=Phymastichus coffea TaxID=108790 RepID=UPI00273B7D24|nr:EF-hand domain-containing protein 1-like [Phymastichus coffea]
MESLPLLPGYIFSDTDPLLKDYKVKQKLKYSNGLPVIRDDLNPDDVKCNAMFVEHIPELTYGRPRGYNLFEHQRFQPHYALYARKCLSFDAYFKQSVHGSPLEYYRVRRVRIIYYLEDDTMMVSEPKVENVGFLQGKLVKRHRIPRSNGEAYHWKDLNVGINLEIYGIVYRVYSCDAYTREFLTSQGIDVSEPEDLPQDPYTKNRKESGVIGVLSHTSKSFDDKLYKFLEYDGMVLSFEASWNDEQYRIMYFLVDDTIAVCEVRRPNDGKDMRGCLMLKRTKVPKSWTDVPSSYAGAYLEKTDQEVKEYYSPKDLKIGETIFIFGRRFFLHDCDPFTRRYYSTILRFDQPARIPLLDLCPKPKFCIKRSDETKHRDLIRQLYNFPKRLRYSLAMEACHPEDVGREFIMEYSLADGCIRINERDKKNSGRKAGRFLSWVRIPKPATDDYYTPEDFAIGARLNIFGHWFLITGTEVFVYKYMMANPDKFDASLRDAVKRFLKDKGLIDEEEKVECKCEDEKEENDKDDQVDC